MPIKVDFTGVEAGGGGGSVRVPEGDYRVKVKGVKHGKSKEDNPMLTWEFVGVEGKLKGKKIKDYTVLTESSLWKLMNLFAAMGLKVPSKKVDIAPLLKKALGKELGVTLTDEEYKNKMSSKITDYLTLEDLAEADDPGDDDEDEKSSKKGKKGKKGKKKGKKGSDDDDTIEELDLDGL